MPRPRLSWDGDPVRFDHRSVRRFGARGCLSFVYVDPFIQGAGARLCPASSSLEQASGKNVGVVIRPYGDVTGWLSDLPAGKNFVWDLVLADEHP